MKISPWILALALTTQCAWARPLQLDFEVERVHQQADKQPETATYPMRVVMTDNRLQYNSESMHELHDFKSRRSHYWGGGERRECSLFAFPDGRHQEMEHRRRMAQALAKAGAEEASFGEVFLEHLFSMTAEGGTEEPTIVTAPTLKMTMGETVLAEGSSDGETLPAEDMAHYIRFLRYCCGGHPSLLNKIREGGKIPKTLTLNMVNFKQQTRFRLQLVKVTANPAEPQPSTTDKPVETRLSKLQARVGSIGAAQIRRRYQANLKRAANEIKLKQPMRAALIYFDSMLSRGRGLPPEYVKQKTVFAKDKGSKMLLDALIAGRKDPVKGAAQLKQLEPKAGDMAYVLKIFQAGLRVDSRAVEDGLNLYFAALEAQPLVAGAWVDVANLYWGDFRPEEAWACWETAHRLAPDHEMLGAFRDREKALLELYSEYF